MCGAVRRWLVGIPCYRLSGGKIQFLLYLLHHAQLVAKNCELLSRGLILTCPGLKSHCECHRGDNCTGHSADHRKGWVSNPVNSKPVPKRPDYQSNRKHTSPAEDDVQRPSCQGCIGCQQTNNETPCLPSEERKQDQSGNKRS